MGCHLEWLPAQQGIAADGSDNDQPQGQDKVTTTWKSRGCRSGGICCDNCKERWKQCWSTVAVHGEWIYLLQGQGRTLILNPIYCIIIIIMQ